MADTALSNSLPSDTSPGTFVDRPTYKWWVTWTIMIGSFLFALDTTIVNIAIPKIMVSIGADLNEIQWVLMIYMIGMAVVMPTSGWLSDIFGHKWLYTGSLALFTISSVLCGMAWNPTSLIIFRGLQGLGAGAIAPTAMAVIFHVFPPEQRGLGMGIYSLGWTFGPLLGPTLGGYLTDTLSWRSIFYLNLPLGIVGVIMAATIMAGDLSNRRTRRFDLFGLVTMTSAIVTLLIVLSHGHQEGWSSSYIVWLCIIASVSLALFLILELRAEDPLINLRLYRDPTYAMASVAGLLLGFGMFGSNLLLPLFLQDFLDYTALQAAMLMLPGVVLSGILSPMSGKWCDRYNPRLFLVLGFLISAVSTYVFTWVGIETEEKTMVWSLLLRGGLGLVFAPLAMLGLRTLPRGEISAASGLLNITRQIAGMGGIALAGVLLERWHYVHHITGAVHLADVPIELNQVQGQLDWLLYSSGEMGEAMQVKSQAILSQYLNQASLSIAFQDCFIVFTVVFIVAVLASLCIPGGASKEA